MSSISIRLSKTAAEKVRRPADLATLKQAVVDAYRAAGAGDIYFALFQANGRQFAFSSRTVIDVEWLPNRLPDKIIRQAPKLPAKAEATKGKLKKRTKG